jgi:hypothetical protein
VHECPKVVAPACPPPEMVIEKQEPRHVEVTHIPESYQELYTVFDVYIVAKQLLQERYTSYVNVLIAGGSTNDNIQIRAQELYAAALEYNQALNQVNNARRAFNYTAQLLQPDNLYTVLARGILRSHNLELPA